METSIIGYTASGVSIVAFGLQFLHTVKCGTIEGISLPRTMLDTVSLSIWVFYATRTEDIPLLIATSCELVLSVCICILVVKHAYTKKSCIEGGPLPFLGSDSKEPLEFQGSTATATVAIADSQENPV